MTRSEQSKTNGQEGEHIRQHTRRRQKRKYGDPRSHFQIQSPLKTLLVERQKQISITFQRIYG